MAAPAHSSNSLTKTAAERSGEDGNQWTLVVIAGLAIFMAQLDTTITNVALPHIEADLAVSTATTQWVVLAYLVPLIGFSLLTGRWLDLIGRRPALTVAVTGFAVASVLAGASPNAAVLLAARAVQGTFAALLMALAPVLALRAVRASARSRALGFVGALAPLGAMTGPVVGGWMVDSLGWPWIFHTNVPLAVVILVLGRRHLPTGERLRMPRRSWLFEAVVLGGAAVTILLAGTFAAHGGLRWVVLAVAAVPLLMLWRRMEVARPVRALLAQPGMSAVHIAFVSAYTVLLLVQFLVPFYLVRVVDVSASVAGVTLVTLPAATAASGLIGGAVADRLGNRPVAITGAALIVVGVALLLPLSGAWVPAAVAWRLAVTGFAFGLFMTPSLSMALALAPSELVGVTSASTNLARVLGLALGPVVATSVWATSGYHVAGMQVALGVALVAGMTTVVALTRLPHHRPALRQVSSDTSTQASSCRLQPAPAHGHGRDAGTKVKVASAAEPDSVPPASTNEIRRRPHEPAR